MGLTPTPTNTQLDWQVASFAAQVFRHAASEACAGVTIVPLTTEVLLVLAATALVVAGPVVVD